MKAGLRCWLVGHRWSDWHMGSDGCDYRHCERCGEWESLMRPE